MKSIFKKAASLALALALTASVALQGGLATALSAGASDYTVTTEGTEDPLTYRSTISSTKLYGSSTTYGVTTPTVPSKLSSYKKYTIIDVSHHQGEINWTSVKKAGINAAIIRVGYRGYGSAGTLKLDSRFEENIKGAINAGIQVGVYFFTQAVNTTEAVAEADLVLSAIKNYNITLPVYYDIEHIDYDTGRLDAANLSKSAQTALCTAFCDRIQSNGYAAGVYASKYYFYDELNYSELQNKYNIWLAHYSSSTDYSGNIDAWQYSSSGVVSGISGNVDLSLWFGTSPSAVSSVTAKRTSSSVTLSWSRPRGGCFFKIERYDKSSGSYVKVGETSNTSYTITGTGITSSKYRVTAFKKMGSDYFYSSATECASSYLESTSLDSYEVTANSVTVKVKSNGSEAYEVCICHDTAFKSGSYRRTMLTDGNLTTTFSDLVNPGDTYYIRVRAAEKINGEWYYSDAKTTTIKLSTPDPVVKSVEVTSSSVKYTFQDESMTAYDVWVCPDESFSDSNTQYVRVKGTNIVSFTGLENAGSVYYVRYRSADYENDKWYYSNTVSDTVRLNTVAPTAEEITATANSVTVTVAADGADYYEVWLSSDNSFSDENTDSVTLTDTFTVTFAGLNNAVGVYHLRIRSATTIDGELVYSDYAEESVSLEDIKTPSELILKSGSGITVNYLSSTTESTLNVDIKLANEEVIETVAVSDGEISLENIPDGTYTMTFSADNCASRSYTVTVENGALTEELTVELELMGDINGDGYVNIKDMSLMYKYINKTNTLDEYQLACANLAGDDDAVNIKDYSKLYKHINRTYSIFE